MERIYYLNREKTSLEDVLSYLEEQLVYNGDTNNFESLGIDFEDIEEEVDINNNIDETFELYLNAEQRQKILNESKNIDYDNDKNLLDYKDDTELCFYRKGRWSVYLAVYGGYLKWTLSEHFIEDGEENLQNICCNIWDTHDIKDLAQTYLYKYAKEEYENFKTIWDMGE